MLNIPRLNLFERMKITRNPTHTKWEGQIHRINDSGRKSYENYISLLFVSAQQK